MARPILHGLARGEADAHARFPPTRQGTFRHDGASERRHDPLADRHAQAESRCTRISPLHADPGRFRRGPIQVAWPALVFPSLVINHLGQGALLISDPAAIENPFL